MNFIFLHSFRIVDGHFIFDLTVKLSNWGSIFGILAGIASAFTGVNVFLDFLSVRIKKYLRNKAKLAELRTKVNAKLIKLQDLTKGNVSLDLKGEFIQLFEGIKRLGDIQVEITEKSQKDKIKCNASGLFLYTFLSCMYLIGIAALQDERYLVNFEPYVLIWNFLSISVVLLTLLSYLIHNFSFFNKHPLLYSINTYGIAITITTVLFNWKSVSNIKDFWFVQLLFHNLTSGTKIIEMFDRIHFSTVILGITFCSLPIILLLHKMVFSVPKDINRLYAEFDALDRRLDQDMEKFSIKQVEKALKPEPAATQTGSGGANSNTSNVKKSRKRPGGSAQEPAAS